MWRRRLLFLAILILLAAATLYVAARLEILPDRYNPLRPIDLAETPGLMTDVKLFLMSGDARACRAALRKAGVAFKEMPARSESPGCEREDTILIGQLSQAQLRPEEMRCDVALRLYLLERHGIQPLARAQLGASVQRISHFGSYSCRKKRGGSTMSEHATANAFDISGFVLADGRQITLKKDWTRNGATGSFLRDVREQACTWFNMVLSPDYNSDHADHFHVDMGWFPGCH
jgi:hypothetical protein